MTLNQLELTELDRTAGMLRQDCTVADVYLITGALSATVRTGSGDWRRLVRFPLEGLQTR